MARKLDYLDNGIKDRVGVALAYPGALGGLFKVIGLFEYDIHILHGEYDHALDRYTLREQRF